MQLHASVLFSIPQEVSPSTKRKTKKEKGQMEICRQPQIPQSRKREEKLNFRRHSLPGRLEVQQLKWSSSKKEEHDVKGKEAEDRWRVALFTFAFLHESKSDSSR